MARIEFQLPDESKAIYERAAKESGLLLSSSIRIVLNAAIDGVSHEVFLAINPGEITETHKEFADATIAAIPAGAIQNGKRVYVPNPRKKR